MSVGTENFVDALRGEYGKDMVKNPGHYIGIKGLEVREVEENFLPKFQDGHLAHLAGAALEYLLRAPSKTQISGGSRKTALPGRGDGCLCQN